MFSRQQGSRTSAHALSVTNTQQVALYGVFISVALNATGQVLFKAARTSQQGASFFELFLHPETWLGFVLYGLSSVIWLWVLSRTHLSAAYPILALAFPIVVGLSAVLFGESISMLRWCGVGLILVGVSLLAKS